MTDAKDQFRRSIELVRQDHQLHFLTRPFPYPVSNCFKRILRNSNAVDYSAVAALLRTNHPEAFQFFAYHIMR